MEKIRAAKIPPGLVAADLRTRPTDFASGVLCDHCTGITVGGQRCCTGVESSRDRPWETERMVRPALIPPTPGAPICVQPAEVLW